MQRIVTIFIFSLLGIVAKAQTTEIDSLKNLLSKHRKVDTVRIDLLNQIGRKLYAVDIEKAFRYATEADSISRIAGYKSGEALSLKLIGYYHENKHDFKKTFEYYRKSLKIYDELGNKNDVAKSYFSIGFVYFRQGDHINALDNFKKSQEIYEQLGDKAGLAKCNLIQGYIYKDKGDYSMSLEHFQKALEIYEEQGNQQQVADCYNNSGAVYYSQGNYPKALNYFKNSLEKFKELGLKSNVANCYNNIGLVYNKQSDYYQALIQYQKSLGIAEELGDKVGVSHCYNNMGLIYQNQEDFTKALEFFQKSLEIDKELDDKSGISKSYNNIGNMHKEQSEYNKALEYFQKSLAITEKLGEKGGIARTNNYIGTTYFELENLPKALEYYQKSLKTCIEIGDKSSEASNYFGIGSVLFKQKQYNQAHTYSKLAFTLAEEIGEAVLLKSSAEVLAQSCEALGLFEDAYKAHVVFKTMHDSLYNEKNVKKLTGLEFQYKYEKEKKLAEAEQAKKDALRASEERRQRLIRNALIVGFAFMVLLALVIYRSFLHKRKANHQLTMQKKIIQRTNEELNQTNEELKILLETVSRQKEQITDSINYASRIQTAALPSLKFREEILPEHFILFKPRDIVSGDFYWMQKVDKYLMVAAVDCTGHGVPGAFMSMLGISFLNEIVTTKGIRQANHVLEELRERVKKTLNQTGKNAESKDGMDMAFYVIDTETNTLQFSGANNPLFLYRNNELTELKAVRQPIGIYAKERPFEGHDIQLEKGDCVYTFSDGYIDQFGGTKGRKFLSKRFKNTLVQIQDKSMADQQQILEQTFDAWRGEGEQVDDVLVIGVKI